MQPMSDITAITMPKWGLTMTEGKILRWLKHEGDAVAASDELLEIETTKITNVMEAGETGTLRRIVAPEGATLPIGGLMAVLAPADIADQDIDSFIAGFAVPVSTDDEAAKADGPEPRELDAGGKRLRYLEMGAGDGPPVVFIHGFGADLNTWMFNQPALVERHRTIALDLPGHGGSTKTLDQAVDAASFAADIDRALAALSIDRVHLVGHSMGGAIALTFANWQPDRVASLTLIAPASLGEEINAAFIAGFVKMERRRDAQEVLRLLVHDPDLVGRAMVEDVLRYKRLDGVTNALQALAEEWFPNGAQRVGMAPVLAGLAMPVQIIWGRDDCIIPAAHGEALAGKLPVHILDGAGHLPHMEKSAEVNRLIARFVEGA
jgi:pyruvate dehydrogenase E2 component (dihydrolipoamide acetyltransferase)